MAEKIPSKKIEAKAGAAPAGAAQPPKPGFSWSRFIIIFLGIMAIFIMIDGNMRMGFASGVDVILYPVIGFGGGYPVITLLIAGILMTVFSTVVRHYLTDWIEQARIQKIQQAYNKANMDALRKGDLQKQKRLNERKLEMMQMNTKMMKSQIKIMALTMFLIMVVFAWMWLFLGRLENATFAVPWSLDINYNDNPLLLPNWILLYSLVSLPASQVLTRVLKHYSLSKIYREKYAEKPRKWEKKEPQAEGAKVSDLQDELDGKGK